LRRSLRARSRDFGLEWIPAGLELLVRLRLILIDNESMRLAPKGEVVDIWIVDLSVAEQTLQRAQTVLSEDELQRSRRFRFPVDCRRFVMARANLRRILASYLHVAAQTLVFDYSEYGKPTLSRPQSQMRFNVSRSGERALIACTQGREVGVDIEKERQDIEIDDLAKRFFTAPENAKLQAFPLPDRYQAFLRCWTCKEAFVKAVGRGLSLGLDKFDVSLGIGEPGSGGATSTEKFSVDGWSLSPIVSNTLEGYISAAAVEGAGIELRVRTPDEIPG